MRDCLRVVCALSGNVLCEIPDLPAYRNVAELKARLAAVLQIREAEQQLLFNGRCLYGMEELDKVFASDKQTSPNEIALVRLDSFWARKIEGLRFGTSSLSDSDAESLRANPEAVLAAVSMDPCQLQHAAETLRSDEQFLILAAKENFRVLEHIQPPWNTNAEIVCAAVSRCCEALKYSDPGCKQLMMSVVRKHPEALQYASKRLREDVEVVAAAISNDGRVLQHAAPCRRADKDIVLLALQQNVHALKAASRHLCGNMEVMQAAVRRDGLMLDLAAGHLQANRELVYNAVAQNFRALRFAAVKVRDDREFILKCVRLDGRSLRFVSKRLRADASVVSAAALQNTGSLKFADERAASKFRAEQLNSQTSQLGRNGELPISGT